MLLPEPDELPSPLLPNPLPNGSVPLFPLPGTNGEFAELFELECTASLMAAPTPADASTNTITATSASARRIPLDAPDGAGAPPQPDGP